MKALIRMRKLTATLALLALTLTLFAPLAQANIPARPIDRPEGPPDPSPTQVGEPDAGGGLPRMMVLRILIAQALSIHLPMANLDSVRLSLRLKGRR